MSVGLQYPHVVKNSGEPARLERLPRIRIAQIATDYLAYGWSAEEMIRQHPHLLQAEVHAALGYYYDHQPEIDAEIKADWQRAQSPRTGPESPFLTRMRAKGIL